VILILIAAHHLSIYAGNPNMKAQSRMQTAPDAAQHRSEQQRARPGRRARARGDGADGDTRSGQHALPPVDQDPRVFDGMGRSLAWVIRDIHRLFTATCNLWFRARA